MAYAAVLSLNQTLEHISNSLPGPEQYKTPLQDQQIESLQERLNSLLYFLDHSWQRSEEVRCLEREIRDAAYKLEDMIDSHISMNFVREDFQERQTRDQTFLEYFEIVAEEIDSLKTKAAKLKELWGATDLLQSQRTSLPTGPSRLSSSGKNAMVGFHNDLIQIMDRLTRGHPPALQIIQVTGMGGIGKTTLATNVYNDPSIEHHFHTRAWVSISQEYREREVLLSLLDSMKQLSDEMRRENDAEKLKDCLYKSLKGRRYLVVMDDVWNTEALDSLRMLFPNEGNGSRIMFTSRLSIAVDSRYHSSSHQMQFLNDADSWNLLRQKVFGDDCFPLELEEAGKEIAKNCRGLPLSLVVMGGHLSKVNRTKDDWEYVAQDVKSVTDANCSDILSLSYDYLPHHLKACFLYMGVFREDAKIRVSKLIKLWTAEGFLKHVIGKTLEEVAEEYLGDLISRNLILFSEKSSRGKIKTCSIHDLLRDICIRKAREENFFHVTDKYVKIFAEDMKYSRRLCIHTDIFPKVLSNSDNSNAKPSLGSLPPVRSILCSGYGNRILGNIYESGDAKKFSLLRVLDDIRNIDDFRTREIKLVHSRYLAFSWRFSIKPKIIPDFLWYLQTLILDCDKIYLPEEIWRMPQLRHLLFVGFFGMCYLPCPARSPIDGENLILANLLTLSKVSGSSCTKEIFERVPNLNKLGIWIEQYEMTPFSLGNVVDLTLLETLKITGGYEYSEYNERVQMNFTFPPNIKKLTLKGCKIAWKDMSVVGLMPSLEVLKLRYCKFDGPEWEPNEGEFCKLKYLLFSQINLVQWRSNNTHFRSLERLRIRECFELEEIPCSIGEIPTLQSIDLDYASPSAVTSAMKIQEEQIYLGNDSLQVHVLQNFQDWHQAIKELNIAEVWSNDETLQLEATTRFNECRHPYDVISRIQTKVISPVVPRFLEFLGRNDYPRLQHEAARAIKSIISPSPADNIAVLSPSDNYIAILIDHGLFPILVSLLSSPKDVLREEALRVLENIALHSTKYRDLVLSYGMLKPILEQFNDKTKISIARMATKTLSSLCRGGPWSQFEQIIPHLAELIHIDDEEVLRNACWALHSLTGGTKDIIQAVIDAGVFPRLVELLLYPSLFVSTSAMYAVGNIISKGDDIQIQVIIDNRVLPFLINEFTKNCNGFAKNAACFVVTSIIRRTGDLIQALIEAGIISHLVQLLQTDDLEIQIEAAETICVAITKGTNEQIKFLVHQGCVKPLCDLLVSTNGIYYVETFLEGLENILKVGEAEKNQGNVNLFAQMIDDADGLQKIKNHQNHCDSEVSELAVRILETYWLEN